MPFPRMNNAPAKKKADEAKEEQSQKPTNNRRSLPAKKPVSASKSKPSRPAASQKPDPSAKHSSTSQKRSETSHREIGRILRSLAVGSTIVDGFIGFVQLVLLSHLCCVSCIHHCRYSRMWLSAATGNVKQLNVALGLDAVHMNFLQNSKTPLYRMLCLRIASCALRSLTVLCCAYSRVRERPDRVRASAAAGRSESQHEVLFLVDHSAHGCDEGAEQRHRPAAAGTQGERCAGVCRAERCSDAAAACCLPARHDETDQAADRCWGLALRRRRRSQFWSDSIFLPFLFFF